MKRSKLPNRKSQNSKPNSKSVIALALSSAIFLANAAYAADAPPVAPAAAAATPTAPASQPSADEIQTAIEAKQYPVAVKLASKMLTLKGPAAAGMDRFQVTMLKGYAQAGMKSMSTAIMTFKSAEKETKDVTQIAQAKWTAELFKTAGSTTFTPKKMAVGAAKPGPFDLLNPDQRKDAFGALLDDDLAALDPKLKSATISQNLPEIWPVLQQVMDLDQLDVVANGNDDKTNTLASNLLDHSRNLLTNALKADWARVSDIDTHANLTTNIPTQIMVGGIMETVNQTRKNGLSMSNTNELKNIVSVCQKIHDAAQAFMSQAKSDKDWNTILSDADRVAGRASDVLSADYGTGSGTGSTIDTSGYNGIPNAQYPGGMNVGVNGGGVTATATATAGPPKTSNATPTKPKPPANGTGKTGTGN
jgi:hypothetical protein